MAWRTIKVHIDGVDKEITEEYDEIKEAEEREKQDRIQLISSRPASEAVLEDVELLRTWVRIHSAWDDIEQHLLSIFKTMTRSDYSIARAAFFSQYTHAGRRKMIETMAKEYFRWHEEEESIFNKAILRVKARSDMRNKLMHGLWGWRIDGFKGSCEIARFEVSPIFIPGARNYAHDELKQVADKMQSTRDCVWEVSELLRNSKSLDAYWGRKLYIP